MDAEAKKEAYAMRKAGDSLKVIKVYMRLHYKVAAPKVEKWVRRWDQELTKSESDKTMQWK